MSSLRHVQPIPSGAHWAARPRSRYRGLGRGEMVAGYLFLLPNLVGFLIFSFFPILFVFGLTFTDWNLATSPRFIGLDNYRELMHDDLFWQTTRNTLYFVFGAVPIGVFLAFWLALLMNRKMKGVIFFRTLFFLPHV